MSSEENSQSRDNMPSGQWFGLESSSSVLLIWDYCEKTKAAKKKIFCIVIFQRHTLIFLEGNI